MVDAGQTLTAIITLLPELMCWPSADDISGDSRASEQLQHHAVERNMLPGHVIRALLAVGQQRPQLRLE